MSENIRVDSACKIKQKYTKIQVTHFGMTLYSIITSAFINSIPEIDSFLGWTVFSKLLTRVTCNKLKYRCKHE